MGKTSIGILAGSLMALIVVVAANNAWANNPINSNWLGVAVKGYDVVAYFTSGQPVKGSRTFSYKWKDATWRFSSAEHMAAFKADPEKYAPQYGGY